MTLVQVLLPLRDNEGRPFSRAALDVVREELATRFGGVTAYMQAPALGVWKEGDDGTTERDEIVVVEVMVDPLDRLWWGEYREELRLRFRQDELVVRAIGMERL